jgi:deoxyribodipyrimidine photolyase-related protein
MKLFLLLGNQLFASKYLNDFKDHIFYMAEDYDLCTFEKHHKHKILLFLSSMRSFSDELKSKNFNLIYTTMAHNLFPKSVKYEGRKQHQSFRIEEVDNLKVKTNFYDEEFKYCDFIDNLNG